MSDDSLWQQLEGPNALDGLLDLVSWWIKLSILVFERWCHRSGVPGPVTVIDFNGVSEVCVSLPSGRLSLYTSNFNTAAVAAQYTCFSQNVIGCILLDKHRAAPNSALFITTSKSVLFFQNSADLRICILQILFFFCKIKEVSIPEKKDWFCTGPGAPSSNFVRTSESYYISHVAFLSLKLQCLRPEVRTAHPFRQNSWSSPELSSLSGLKIIIFVQKEIRCLPR